MPRVKKPVEQQVVPEIPPSDSEGENEIIEEEEPILLDEEIPPPLPAPSGRKKKGPTTGSKKKKTTVPTGASKKARSTSEEKPKKTATTKEEKKVRVPLTPESLVTELDTALALIEEEIKTLQSQETRVKGVRMLQKIKNRIVAVQKGIPRITKHRRVRRQNGLSGFNKPKKPSKELKEFLGLKDGATVSRASATRAICVYIRLSPDEKRETFLEWSYLNPSNRNLQDTQDNTRILPDEKLSKLLHYKEYKDDVKNGKIIHKVTNKEDGTVSDEVVTNDNLYYKVIQKLLSRHLLD